MFAPARMLIPALIVGMPFFGTLLTPAVTLVSEGAQQQRLDQGLAFGLGNLAWAAGQTVAAAGSGALAQATSDLVPYSLLAAACLATLGFAGSVTLPGQEVEQQGVDLVRCIQLQPVTRAFQALVPPRGRHVLGGVGHLRFGVRAVAGAPDAHGGRLHGRQLDRGRSSHLSRSSL
jgi:hypothetical protein